MFLKKVKGGREKMKRRGLSDVVTTILIVLLALAAVVIIWAFIRQTVTGTAQNVQDQSQCFKYSAKIVSCESTGNKVVVSNPNSKKIGLYVTVEGAGSNKALDVDPYSSKEVDFSGIGSIETGKKATVAAIITPENSNEKITCPVTAEPVICT